MGQPSVTTTARPIRRRFAADGRVRSGCLTCKARKKKCDGQASSIDGRCRSCVRLGLVCEQRSLRRVSPPSKDARGDEITVQSSQENEFARETDATSNDDEILVSRPSIPVGSGSWDGIERGLLKYFLDNVAPLCSILQQDGSSFCSVLLPMAIIDPSLLHALFAYASIHSDASTNPVSVTPEARLKFENQVARGVADAITKNAVTETTVACALVISTAEVIGGDTSHWLLHLQGAGHLVNHLGTTRLLRTTDGAFLLRYFAYHDIMASLSTGRRTLINGVYWFQDVNAAVDCADSFMGVAHHIFKHLTQICAFVADTADLDPSSCHDRRSRDAVQAEDMAHALRSQDLHLNLDTSDSHIAALVHHAEAFRFAALFYLYRHLLRFCDGAVYRLRADDCVRQILSHVSQVPSHLFCEIGLLFPLFMAGIGCGGDVGATRYIQNRLACIETWTRFKHVARLRELLGLLWQRGRTDWEVVLRELEWSLSFA